ncbi:MAG: hypothetical protein JST92_22905 [Deltaproteobacteria bacterium]|nr:hypothetical protein [Deltaproteobacteria bacterium]
MARNKTAKPEQAQSSDPIAEARRLLEAGRLAPARAKLEEVAQKGKDDEQAEAARLLAGLGVDLGALGAAGAVLLVIVFAAVRSLLMHQ